jgi:RHS repeat-associated protein
LQRNHSLAAGGVLPEDECVDSDTGLHYNFFRDYDPGTGRYVQSDPIGLAGGINTYSYVNGNPVSYVDPLGLWRWPDFYTISIPTSVPFVGVPVTVDKCGQAYVGIGAGLGRPAVGFAAGWIMQPGTGLSTSPAPTGSNMQKFLTGIGGTYGVVLGLAFDLPSDPSQNQQALLLTTPSLGVAYNWNVGQVPGINPCGCQ